MDTYCNNCGKPGHIYSLCKIPITSVGVIAFRYNITGEIEYLMIRRKDTLGFIDFIRGKYLVQNDQYILNMLNQMTSEEKDLLKTGNFDMLWKYLWGNNSVSMKYKSEEFTSKEKFNMLCTGITNKTRTYTLFQLIDESNSIKCWNEPEWGFPKGRRNYQEKDFDCAVREFCEETGYNDKILKNIDNIVPYEEIFVGSNYKAYKHKYYVMFIGYNQSMQKTQYDKKEVSKIEWKSYDNCINSIRDYNLEKKRILTNINNSLTKYKLFLG
jgi:8-oxo-dGTP pyrophosphatase MutT (NUDIX family)